MPVSESEGLFLERKVLQKSDLETSTMGNVQEKAIS
jgi:hypothetical protein